MCFALRDSVTLVPGLEPEQITGICSRTLQLPPGWRRCSAAGGGGGHDPDPHRLWRQGPHPAIGSLLDRKIAVLETSAQRAVGDKTERLAVLDMPAEEAMELVASRRKRAPPALRGDGAPLHSGGGLHQGALLFYRRLSRHAAISGKERHPHPLEA